MNCDGIASRRRRVRPHTAAVAAACVAMLAACQALVPALTQLGLAFGQDLLATASVNYSPRYAMQVEQLLVAMAREMTGMQFQAQLAAAGYAAPPPQWAQTQQPGQNPYGQGGHGQPGYGQPGYDQGGYPAQDPYGQPTQPYPPQPYPDQGPYGAGTTPPYAQDPNAGYGSQPPADPNYASQPNGSANGGYGTTPPDPNVAAPTGYGQPAGQSQGYGPQAYGQPSQGQPPPTNGYGSANPYGAQTRSVQPILLSVDLLVARAQAGAGAPLEQIEDGAVLHDGRGDPAAGDRLKFRFTANCECFLYIIGVDATGYVARIFPDPNSDSNARNPIEPGREYVLPGDGEWWALDDYRGVEQVHAIASYVERPDIEQALDALAAQVRTPPRDYRGVVAVAEVPSTRGLVKVKDAAPVAVVTQIGKAEFSPTSFLGRADEIGVVVSRWFTHE